MIDLPDQQFLDYLNLVGNFSNSYPYIATAVYTLFISLKEDKKKRRILKFKIKYLFFPLFVFYKYFKPKNLIKNKSVQKFPDASILVIIHGSGPQHYGDLIRVIEELSKNNQKIIVALGSISPKQKEYLSSIKNIAILDQNSAAFNISVRGFIKNIVKSKELLSKLIDIVKSNKKYYAIFNNNKGFLLDQIFICLCHYYFSKKILTNNSIKIVFSSNDGNYFANGYFINANLMGIESVMLHHGFSSRLHLKAISQKVIMWSKSEISYFNNNGFATERLLPYGLPRFDIVANYKLNDNLNLSQLYGLGHGSKLCFFYTMHDNTTHFQFSKIYTDEINSIVPVLYKKGIHLFIRAHPNDNLEDYSKVFSQEVQKVVTILPSEFPLVDLIKQMDICVLNFSVSLIEAMICRVPIIFVNYNNYWDRIGTFLNTNSLYRGCEVKQKFMLVQIIEQILNDRTFRDNLISRQNKFVKENIFNLGFATKSITDYILNQCK